MHYSGAINLVLLIVALVIYTMFPIALIFLFKIARPISNCYIIKNFKSDNKDYGKTTAVVKSTDKFCRKSVICYNVGEREIFVTVPYYISHETISVIYMRCRYNKVIVDCPKLQHKAIIKNFIIFTIIFISGFVIVNIMFGLLK